MSIKEQETGRYATKGVARNELSVQLYLAMMHRLEKNVGAALGTLNRLIDDYPDSIQAVYAFQMLTDLLLETRVDSAIQFLEAVREKHHMHAGRGSFRLYEASLRVLYGQYFAQGMDAEALATLEQLRTEFAGTSSEKHATYALIQRAVNHDGDTLRARELYEVLKIHYPEDIFLSDAQILIGVDPSQTVNKLIVKARADAMKKAQTPTKDDLDGLVVTEFRIDQNYPNPFNPTTRLSYQIPTHGFVALAIYDPLGRMIASLVNEYQDEGRYQITLDADRLGMASSGVYYLSIGVVGSDGRVHSDAKRIVFLK
jgi:hypothetical protein